MPLRRLVLIVGTFLLASGCGAVRFQRAWSRFETGAEQDGLHGRWKGEWRSEWNGHSGGLRCLIEREDEKRHLAWFFSTYARLFFFQHEVAFQVTRGADGTLSFEGEQDLGASFGGVYRYTGSVAGDSFHATFQAVNGDHGVFEMRRVDQGEESPARGPP